MTGAFNAWVWQRAAAAVVHRRPLPRRRLVPVTVIALAGLFAVVLAGSSIGFAAFEEPDEVIPAPAAAGDGPGIVLVPGYASACCDDADGFHEAAAGFRVEQFSYLGFDEAGWPVPHGGDATDRDLVRLADLLHEQVLALARRSGSPVAVVAESEGTLIATAMLTLHPDAPVGRLALLSPILEPGRAHFPEPGEEGPGVVAGYQLRAVMEIIDQISTLPLSADGPLSTSVRRWSDVLAEATIADRPGVEELAVVPLADSVTGRAGAGYEIGVVVVPGFHGGLRSRADVQDLLLTWIRDGGVEGSEVLAALDRLIAGSAAAWHVPSLEEYGDTGS
jgi:pimeloyl-ACP methyl ester carboxylesterase